MVQLKIFYRKYTRTNIIISKIITLVIFSLLYFIISIVVGFILLFSSMILISLKVRG